MPVRWTPDNDQLLLLKILETHDLHVDAKKISSAWPNDKGDAPTARAITERLVKIRENAKKNGAGHFGISSAQSKSSATPRKPKTTGNGSTTGNNTQASPSPVKRKRTSESVGIKAESIESDDEMIISKASRRAMNNLSRAASTTSPPQNFSASGSSTNHYQQAQKPYPASYSQGTVNTPMRDFSVPRAVYDENDSPTKRSNAFTTKPQSHLEHFSDYEGHAWAKSGESQFLDDEAV